ncbi:hypothetical protein [Halopiger goleimassiliensis]|uniref:hypothetical protein n=1 Tax=Halopiger goleimassiliensis TaxID=1293048 RepID=UPI000677DDFC|nr:hypothetical protein [Halopiger goleimassiliensis]
MPRHPTRPPRGSDDGPTAPPSRSRRSVLYAGATAATLAIAGCLDEQSANEGANSPGDEDDGTSDGDADPDDPDVADGDELEELENELFAVLDAYFEAAAAGDLDGIDEVMHSLNPLNPAEWEDDGWEYQGGESEAPSPFEGEVVTGDATVEDVLALEDAEFWFHGVDLEAELGDARIALVRADEAWLEAEADALEDRDDDVGVDYDFETEPEITTWALATEGGEWRILFMGTEDDTPEDPTEAFEEEIVDEDEDVVAEIDWEYEPEDRPGEADGENGAVPFDDVEMARVVFTDDPGLEVDAVRAESTIEGGYIELSDGWAGAWGTVAYHPEGDQIVVRIAQDGEERIVHREHYLP